MNAKRTIQKFIIALVWLAAGSGMLILLVAAMGKQNRQTCQGLEIAIKGDTKESFITEKEILALVKTGANGNVKGKTLNQIDMNKLEALIESNKWIRDAELYFDNRNMLRISIAERSPVARVFTRSGHSFYIDSSAERIPLSQYQTARVPVFTGYPEAKKWNRQDSVLMQQVKEAAILINSNSFWQAQVSQVDITADRQFELIPVIGNHIVLLGDGTELDQKLHRLFTYYKLVAGKKGFDTYDALNVQFAGQVIGVHKGTSLPKVLPQQRNQALQSIQHAYDEKTILRQAEKQPDQKQAPKKAVKPATKTSTATATQKETKPVPKAVMPKRDN